MNKSVNRIPGHFSLSYPIYRNQEKRWTMSMMFLNGRNGSKNRDQRKPDQLRICSKPFPVVQDKKDSAIEKAHLKQVRFFSQFLTLFQSHFNLFFVHDCAPWPHTYQRFVCLAVSIENVNFVAVMSETDVQSRAVIGVPL